MVSPFRARANASMRAYLPLSAVEPGEGLGAARPAVDAYVFIRIP
ncbi:MAG: hypothetical protein U0031_10315 [Thermomicrobiales bacterium]